MDIMMSAGLTPTRFPPYRILHDDLSSDILANTFEYPHCFKSQGFEPSPLPFHKGFYRVTPDVHKNCGNHVNIHVEIPKGKAKTKGTERTAYFLITIKALIFNVLYKNGTQQQPTAAGSPGAFLESTEEVNNISLVRKKIPVMISMA